MEIVYRKLEELKPHPDNPRKPKPGMVAKLAESLKNNPSYFEARPIILSNRTGELVIIDGERRSEAARLLGLTEAPTILMEGLSLEDEKEILIKGNTHSGMWDEKKLERFNVDELKRSLFDGKLPKPVRDDFVKRFNEFNNNNCQCPLVPVADEKYELFVIVSTSSIDSNWLREKLGMQKMRNYKTGEVGKSNVVSIERLKECLSK